MRWSEAVTMEFVKIYLKHECLWNPTHPAYKIRYQRESAYSDICSKFEIATMKSISVLEVKMKIKNLRTTYVQQVNKILQKSSPDEICEPSLVWFHEMDRCLKNIIPNTRHSHAYNTQQKTQEVDSSCQIWVEEELQNFNPEPEAPMSQSEDECVSDNEDKKLSNLKSERRSTTIKKYKKKKLKQHQQRVPTRNYSLDSESVKDDEFDIYGKYIVSQLRKMELQKALRLQLKIQHLISKSRI